MAVAVLICCDGSYNEIRLNITKDDDNKDTLIEAIEKRLGGNVDETGVGCAGLAAFQPEDADAQPRRYSKNFKAMAVLEALGFDTWGAKMAMRGNVIITGNDDAEKRERSLTEEELKEVLAECRGIHVERRSDVEDSSDDDGEEENSEKEEEEEDSCSSSSNEEEEEEEEDDM